MCILNTAASIPSIHEEFLSLSGDEGPLDRLDCLCLKREKFSTDQRQVLYCFRVGLMLSLLL